MNYNFAAPIDVNRHVGMSIPAGVHPVVINNVEFKPSKNQDYAVAVYNFSVLDGVAKGARFNQYLCINTTINDDKHNKCVSINLCKLAKWAKACGITQLVNPQQLVGARFKANIEVEYNGEKESYSIKRAEPLIIVQPAQQSMITQPIQQPTFNEEVPF